MAPEVLIVELVSDPGIPQIAVARVVKFEFAEKLPAPDAQTACTEYSYTVDAVNPAKEYEAKAVLTVTHVALPEGRWRKL